MSTVQAVTAAARALHDISYDCANVPPLSANEHELHWAECLEDAEIILKAATPLIAAAEREHLLLAVRHTCACQSCKNAVAVLTAKNHT
jgi:hypothetical protein